MLRSLLLYVTLYFASIVTVSGQVDTISSKLNFGIEGKAMDLNPLGSSKSRVDPFTGKARIYNNGHVTDNPMIHGAIYAKLHSRYDFMKNSSVTVSAVFEQRGWSYGNKNLQNSLIYPEFKLSLIDTLKLFTLKLPYAIKAGDNGIGDFDDDLRLYNIDLNYVSVSAFVFGFQFTFLDVADAKWGVGNNLEELQKLSLDRSIWLDDESYKWSTKVFLNRNLYYPTSFYQGVDDYYSSGFFTRFSNRKGDAFQISYEYADRETPFEKHYAFSIGIEHKRSIKLLSYSLKPKFRFYGAGFNENHIRRDVPYREGYLPTYANTTGEFLYPIANYYRPVSQWAFYTEYNFRDVYSLEVNAELSINLGRNFQVNSDLDLISLYYKGRTTDGSYTYYFYSAELNYSISNGLDAGGILTNKMMNLDMHYQGFYQLKDPCVGFYLRQRFSWFK